MEVSLEYSLSSLSARFFRHSDFLLLLLFVDICRNTSAFESISQPETSGSPWADPRLDVLDVSDVPDLDESLK